MRNLETVKTMKYGKYENSTEIIDEPMPWPYLDGDEVFERFAHLATLNCEVP